ncbi:MAG TPA: glycosyltransferase [Candidatus Angelobacter sp.]|nr:glycosyltransferase [Candidatus Angelobacter sp.]
MNTQLANPRVLLFSQRNIFGKFLFRCPHFEFENLISQIDSVELLAPQADPSSFRYDLAKRVACRTPILLNPGIPRIRRQTRYDLFFAVCGYPADLLLVDAAISWKDLCTTSVCLIDELWAREIAGYRHYYRLLEKFDVVVLYYSQSVKPLSARIRSKCVFLSPGVDALLFSPYPKPPERSIDVYSIGRRSEITHRALLRMAADDGLFYLHDSIAGDKAVDPAQHRALFANTAKRSRFFIVNPGLIDRPEKTGKQIEIGNRYFEGAASGTIMIGERPHTEAFETLFDWPDAVIHLDYDSSEISRIIDDLDRQPARQESIRRTNVVQSLLRHDWVYRWETILNAVGLAPMPQLRERKRRLQALARQVSAVENACFQTAAER